MRERLTLRESRRFWSKVAVGTEVQCWEWTAALSDTGYGSFNLRGHRVNAHRVAYEDIIGPIPDGLQVDHLCRQRSCVNPYHMELVTQAENKRRGHSGGARFSPTCRYGHPYTPENTGRYSWNGARKCLTCERGRIARRGAANA